MKKQLLLLVACIPFLAHAQLTMDDFESYTPGSFDSQWDATQWTGWFGGASGTEISDEQAASGMNSLKVTNSPEANDVVALLPTLTEGLYELSIMQYIPAASEGYLNLQHAYTNTTADWAADIYFTDSSTGLGQINTDGVGFTFPIVHDTWASIRFVLNFLSEEGQFYYNNQLIHTWVLSTNAAGGPGLNQINGINFFSACADQTSNCSSLAYYDDIVLTEMSLPSYDLRFNSIAAPTQYPNVPLSQTQSLNLEASIQNIGINAATNVVVLATISDDNGVVATETLGTIASLGSTETMTLTGANSFTPSSVGAYTIDYSVSMDETDESMDNNGSSFGFAVTEDVYSRDNGVYDNGIGTNGVASIIGQFFEIVEEDNLKAIRISYAGGAVGETLQGTILSLENGLPIDLVAATEVFTFEQIGGGVGAEITVDLPFVSTVQLPVGEYMFAIEQQGLTNMILSTSQSVFTPNTTLASTDGGAMWGTLESLNFPVALAIRPIFGEVSVAVEEPVFATSIQLTPTITSNQSMLTMDLEQATDLDIHIFDLNGQLVFSQTESHANGFLQIPLNVSNLASGMYIVNINQNGKIASRKLTVVK